MQVTISSESLATIYRTTARHKLDNLCLENLMSHISRMLFTNILRMFRTYVDLDLKIIANGEFDLLEELFQHSI